MAAPKAASRTLYLDTLSAQKEVEVLTKKVEKLDKTIAEGQASGKKMTRELADLDKAKASLASVQNQIDKGLKPSLKQLEDLARKTNNELKRMSQSDPEFNKKIQIYKDATSQIRILKAEINGVSKAQSTWLGNVKQFGGGLLTGFAAGFGIQAISNFISDANVEFEEAELSAARFEAKLRNLGRLDVLPRLTAEADKLAQQFGFLDNDDITNVFSKLIDYGRLTEKQIKQLTPVIIDFAANQRISLEEASSALIKALEGNGKSLKEYGIDMRDAKDTTEAFGIIMEQVAPKVQGAAETFKNSSAGVKAQTKQDIAEIKESIGGQLQPAILSFYKFMSGVLDGISSFFSNVGGNLKTFVKEALGAGTRLLGVETTRNKGAGNFTVNQNQVDAEVDAFVKADEEKQQRIMKALASQYRQNINAYQKAVRENDKEAIKTYALLVNTDAAVLRNINKVKKPDNTILGSSTVKTLKDEPKEKEKIKENPRFKLLRELKQLEDELELLGKTNDEKELNRIVNKYQKLITEAQAYADIVIRLEAAQNKEVANLIEQVTKKQEEEKKKQEELEKQKTVKLRDELMKRKESELDLARADGADKLDRLNRSDLATAKINLINSPAGQARLQAQIDLLELERDQELQNVKLTEEEKELIRAEYRQRTAELEIEFYTQQVEQILGYTQQIIGIVDQFYQAQSNRENARLQKEIKANDQKRTAYKKLLDARVISETEYRKRIAALDAQEDRRKKELEIKQFKRAKAAQIAQAIISGALAVVSTLAARPGATDILSLGAFRAINIAIAVATTAAQIATIASQKPPELAKGGIVEGGRHSEGGVDLYDHKSKRVVGNVEGGEPLLVLSRNTYANNADVVDELLDASMNRGGARIRPFWKNRPYEGMNFGRANRALSKRYYATGGVVDTGGGAAAVADTGTADMLNEMKQVMMYMAETNARLNATLEKGIEANMSLKKFRDAETLDQQILDDSVFRP